MKETKNGPLGFPMRDDIASELEEIMKNSSQDCKDIGYKRTAVMNHVDSIDKEERTDVSWITTDAVDAHKTVILPDGIDWSLLQKSGIPATWNHNYDELPLGRALWIKRSKSQGKNGWSAKTKYSSKPEGWTGDWFADAVFHLVAEGTISGKSIGFYPISVREPTTQELRDNKEWKNIRAVIDKVLGIEYAITYTPSNMECILRSTITVPELIQRDMGLYICQQNEEVVRVAQPEEKDMKKDLKKPKKNLLNDLYLATEKELNRKLNDVIILPKIKALDVDNLAMEYIRTNYHPDFERMLQDAIDRRRGKIK